jgi:hypothetical protein
MPVATAKRNIVSLGAEKAMNRNRPGKDMSTISMMGKYFWIT